MYAAISIWSFWQRHERPLAASTNIKNHPDLNAESSQLYDAAVIFTFDHGYVFRSGTQPSRIDVISGGVESI